jgi:hypothetical protein
MPSRADLEFAVEFRQRLAEFVKSVPEYRQEDGTFYTFYRSTIASDQAWLFQRYGRIYKAIAPYGIVQFRESGAVISQDVVIDAIGSLDHPAYGDIAAMAIKQIDLAIGRLRADVDQAIEEARSRSADDLYRLTSPVFWLGRLASLLRWIVGTARGRIVAVLGALLIAIVSGIASGVAQTWFQRLTTGH